MSDVTQRHCRGYEEQVADRKQLGEYQRGLQDRGHRPVLSLRRLIFILSMPKGDTPPIAVIQGPKTQLDWPGAMARSILDSQEPYTWQTMLVSRSSPFMKLTKETSRRRESLRATAPASAIRQAYFVDNTKNKGTLGFQPGQFLRNSLSARRGNWKMCLPLRTIRSRPEGMDSAEIRQNPGVGLRQ